MKNTQLNDKKRILELRNLINKYNYEYYVLNESSVDDFFFDKLLNELIELEKKHPDLITKDSPTQVVGGEAYSNFKKDDHIIPMLSLKNGFNIEDIIHFENQIKKSTDENFSYYIEPTIDCVSISLTYDEGKLIRALTRGNGLVGDNVFENINEIESIPKNINIKDKIEIRGEIFINISKFNEINSEISLSKNKSEKKFANPRNLVSGTIRQLDTKKIKQRDLKFFPFMIIDWKSKNYYFETQSKTISELKKNGFETNKFSVKVNNIDEINENLLKISRERKKINYEIDGVVIKINEYSIYDKIGYTSKFPKWAIAYKFPTEVKETVLKDIFITIGRTGRVTYNAKLESVWILGTNVQRATLHNSQYIKDLNINVNDVVFVKKAGEIIPKVIGLSKKNNNEIWKEQTHCPICNSELIRYKYEIDQYCPNHNCKSQIIEKMNHFVSRKAMNIEGLSKQQIILFYEKKFLNKISDIYNLYKYKDEILKLSGYKEKSINKLLFSIENSKKRNLDKVIFALGIRHIGEKASLDLSIKYNNIDVISKLNMEELINDDDFGEVKSESLVNWFSNNENIDLIKELKSQNINFEYIRNTDLKVDENYILYNKNILITGKHDNLSRIELEEHFRKMGANVKKTFSKNIDYILVGKNPSQSKISKISNEKIIEINKILNNE